MADRGLADKARAERPRLYLASRSSRRRELLARIGVPFTLVEAQVEEVARPREAPTTFVRRMAREKALAGVEGLKRAFGAIELARGGAVLGADTVVVVDSAIVGKPTDRDDALTQLARISGRHHDVMTAVALISRSDGDGLRIDSRLSRSRVWFRALTDQERVAYWGSGEPAGKAGSYAVQGLAAQFIVRLEGSYSGVVGLPLYETSELLRGVGLAPSFSVARTGDVTHGDKDGD